MRTKTAELSPHSKKVLEFLQKQHKPFSAYELLEKLGKFGVKAPSTVYRALEPLVERGLVHRVESINAFLACHSDDEHEHGEHNARFAVCKSCGSVSEIHDQRLTALISELAKKLQFHIEREMMELMGLCHACHLKQQEA